MSSQQVPSWEDVLAIATQSRISWQEAVAIATQQAATGLSRPLSPKSTTPSSSGDETATSTPPESRENSDDSTTVFPADLPSKLIPAWNQLLHVKSLAKKKVTYIAIDVEKHFWPLEKYAAVPVRPVLEVGITVWDGGETNFEKMKQNSQHYIIEEYVLKHNTKIKGGIYNQKNRFLGTGRDSTKISIDKIGGEVQSQVAEYEKQGEVVLILHGGSGDMKDLVKMGIKVNHLKVLDTQLVHKAMDWDGAGQQISLLNLLKRSGFKQEEDVPFHNAGNDAIYTMLAFSGQRAKLMAEDNILE